MTHDAKASHAAWYLTHGDQERARLREWYRKNREHKKAQSAARYRAKRVEVLATVAAYKRTAAGMLAEVRHDAKNRGTR